MDQIDLSQVNADFNENTEPKDDYLMGLLKQAYTRRMQCRNAFIKFDRIKPFSDFRPQTSQNYRDYFEQRLQSGRTDPLYVYPKDGSYIMSDDYNAYYLYKEHGIDEVPCVVLDGTAELPGTVYVSEPYYLDPPTSAEII
jgi:hypothetical protein